jgi:hypothetical protein
MSIENGQPGYFSGFQGAAVEPEQPAELPSLQPSQATNGQEQAANLSSGDGARGDASQDSEGPSELAIRGNGESPGVALPDDLTGKLPGFTKPASDCINKARRIARELNHTSVSAAHLALALTLDPRSSRRLRDQDVDVDLVREAAVQFLAKYNSMYSSGTPAVEEPQPAPDLSDILETATRFAQEREGEEEINISDLLDAFRKSGSRARLLYSPQDTSDQAPAIVRRMEQWLVPQLDQLFCEMERRLLEHAEERINTLVSEAGMQLGGQIASLRQVGFQLTDVANAIAQANAKRQAEGSRWPFGGR